MASRWKSSFYMVAPLVGAWIEIIMLFMVLLLVLVGRSSRGSVD